jgi:hypothetical protein
VNQGKNAIAIGYNAGITGQPNNSIVLNASGETFNSTFENSFFISVFDVKWLYYKKLLINFILFPLCINITEGYLG